MRHLKSFPIFEKLESTLDNGGKPFVLDIENNYVRVYNQKHTFDPKRIFSGKGKDKGSSFLLDLGENKYVFIGDKIYEFIPPEKIEDYYTPIGNSGVPYPVSITKNFVIFMLEQKIVEKGKFKDLNKKNLYGQFYNDIKDVDKKKLQGVKKIEGRILREIK